MNFSDSEWLRIDARAETERISKTLRQQVRKLKRRGLVLGLSGGVDSSVSASLAVQALGAERVFGLLMPERDSSEDSVALGRQVAESLGIEYQIEDLTAVLDAAGCYSRRDDAVRSVIPDYADDWKCKLVLPSSSEPGYGLFSLVAQAPDGKRQRCRLPLKAYLGVVAATNFKQRSRKMMEYHHADRLNFAVVGTPNRLEYELGFFVKQGDAQADVKPIAHLYKSQVYQLARELGVPKTVIDRPPSTDTYSLSQSQDEFYFQLPLFELDVCLFGWNQGFLAETVAAEVGREAKEVERVYRDIESKKRAAAYLHAAPLLVEEVSKTR